MRYLWIVLLIGMAGVAGAKTCEECPPAMYDMMTDNGVVKVRGLGGAGNCSVTEPAGDGCNTCTFEVWCEDGKWYRSQYGMCTLMGCYRPTPLDWNPTK